MANLAQFISQYDASDRAQFVSQYFDTAITTTIQADDFDSAIGSATIVDAATSTPDITLVPYDGGEIGGWLTIYVRVNGVDGKTPAFDIDLSDHASVNAPTRDWGMLWRYVDDVTVPADGRPRAWNFFDNNAGDSAHTFSNNSAFTSDVIEIAMKPRWRYLDTQRVIDYIEGSGLAVELPSSIAASGLPKHAHAQFTHSGTTRNTAPKIAINMYGIGVDDTSVSPTGGDDKLNLVLMTGLHSSEDQGNDACWETVQFYINGTGTVADWFRQYCRLFVYDGNPEGRYYGQERFTDETGGDEDANRAWDDTGSEQVESVKSALTADVSRVDVTFDYHGAFQLNFNGLNAEYGTYAHQTLDSTWLTRARALISPYSIFDMGDNVVGSYQEYGNDILLAQLSLTLEFAVASPGFPDLEATYEPVAEAYIGALQAMVAAEELTLTFTGTNLTPGLGTIAMSGLAPTVSAQADVSPGVGSVALSGSAVDVEDVTVVDPAAGEMAITGSPVTVESPANIQPGQGTYGITGIAVSVLTSVEIAPALGSTALTGFDLSVLADVDIAAGIGSLSLNGFSVTVDDEQTTSINPGAGSIALAGEIVGLSAVSDLTPGIGSLALSGEAVSVESGFTLSPGLASITCAGMAVTLDAITSGGLQHIGLPMLVMNKPTAVESLNYPVVQTVSFRTRLQIK